MPCFGKPPHNGGLAAPHPAGHRQSRVQLPNVATRVSHRQVRLFLTGGSMNPRSHWPNLTGYRFCDHRLFREGMNSAGDEKARFRSDPNAPLSVSGVSTFKIQGSITSVKGGKEKEGELHKSDSMLQGTYGCSAICCWSAVLGS